MRSFFVLLTHFICTLVKVLRPGGVRALVAENLALRQQLIVLKRKSKRCPKLSTFDRLFFGFMSLLTGVKRINKFSIIIKPSTVLRFHKALVNRKYQTLFSNKRKLKPGRKAPEQWLVDLVIQIKQENPDFGYGRIAMQIYQAFGVEISRFAVGRILRKNFDKLPSNDGPSWLSFLGNIKDSLWSVDIFRCESIAFKSHWVMVVMDHFSRRIIGFAVHAGDCDGLAYCRMFNSILSGHSPPKYLSTDNDPLYLFQRWQANLRILEIKEVKSVPHTPTSHPFIERVIGTVRREYLDKTLFFNKTDLQKKLDHYKDYYNQERGHTSLNSETPSVLSSGVNLEREIENKRQYCWKAYCNGLYKLPVAA